LQPPNSAVSKPYPVKTKNHGTESLKDFLLEIRFLFSYLDFKWPPFPYRLSWNAEILRHKIAYTQVCVQIGILVQEFGVSMDTRLLRSG
jgi:hypothetical protein